MHAFSPLSAEFKKCVFADKRLGQRAQRAIEEIARDPSRSFPVAFSDPSQLEGFYRFVGNERVTLDGVISGHIAQTLTRAGAKKRCLAVHDTTDFQFSGDRDDLGLVDQNQRGFYAHVCLCVSADGLREPLGLLDLDTWTRQEKKGKRTIDERKADPEVESRRWLEQSLNVEDLIEQRTQLIHVEDREGDIFESLEMRIAHDMHFIVRAASTKLVLTDEGEENILEHARRLPKVSTRAIHLSARQEKYSSKKMKLQHPPRAERDSEIQIRAGQLRVRKPKRSGSVPELWLNAVHVLETDAPEGETPVEWLLLTTEPISSKNEVEEVVDNYRARWLIEEYFKAIKTGCKYEERQLESLHALLNALGLFAVMAWRLLQLRFIERNVAGEAPASTVASKAEIAVLERKAKMKPGATAREFLLRLARLGGHLPQNGRPGLLVLWRGLRKLLDFTEGYELATEM